MKILKVAISPAFCILFSVYSIHCSAAYSPASIAVHDELITVTKKLDKSQPVEIPIWDKESGGAGSAGESPLPRDDYNYYGRMNWTCGSETDPVNGACATQPSWLLSGGTTSISLKFTEKKTGVSVNLKLSAYNDKTTLSGRVITTQPMQSAGSAYPAAQSLLTLAIPQSQLSLIPIGGTWSAKLILNQWSWDPNKKEATWVANIKLDIVDRQNIQVYLPKYGVSPVINLNLKDAGRGAKGTIISGTEDVDLCLYDGYNAQSSSYEITMSSSNTTEKSYYQLLNKSADTDSKLRNYINYLVTFSTPTAPTVFTLAARNGVPFTFNNISSSTPKKVSLPNIPNQVYCTPLMMRIRTAYTIREQQAPGRYQDVLKFKFTPSSTNL